MNMSRAVALILAELHPSDRRWITSRLPQASTASVRSEMKIAQTIVRRPDSKHVQAIVRQLLDAQSAEHRREIDQSVEFLDRLPANDIVNMLQTYPPSLARVIANMRSWRWKATVASQLSLHPHALAPTGVTEAARVLLMETFIRDCTKAGLLNFQDLAAIPPSKTGLKQWGG